MSEETSLNAVELATEITIAWLNNPNNRVGADDVPAFLRSVHATVNDLATSASAAETAGDSSPEYTPAVSVRRSLASKDHILSLIDGKPYKTLTRHLTRHGLTAEQYKERYGLKADYPMVAENYAAHRRELAKRIGLGRRPAQAAVTDAPAEAVATAAPAEKKAGRGRPAAASADAAPAKATRAKAAPKSKAAPKRKAAAPKAETPVEASAE